MSPCTSPWLSVRLISRLSPLRRANLERRLLERLADAERGVDGRGNPKTFGRPTVHASRLALMVGRAAMLISNAELRERSERHG